MGTLIIIVLLAVLFWIFVILPQRRRTRSHEAMQDDLRLGDEIITAGGLHAVVKELGDEQLQVEIAPGVVATLDRRAVAAVARQLPEDEAGDETGLEAR